jgi:hypothetical protein
MRQAANSARFHEWITEHRKAVYAGIWDVLQGCMDLCPGQPGFYRVADVAEEIAADVWMWVAANVDKLLKPGSASLANRLRARAEWQVRAWKTDRLRHRDVPVVSIADTLPVFEDGSTAREEIEDDRPILGEFDEDDSERDLDSYTDEESESEPIAA